MSNVNDNKTHAKKVVTLKDKATVTISRELLNQIQVLHKNVGGDEWSGILIYSTTEGRIEEPGTWKILAEKVIPMDIGNASYTEYEINPDDEFSFEAWTDALEQGKKMGHIHTHHGMETFFSGTDMSELHDNAPKYNYYLSLIVNFKEYHKWCAKVAFCGTIEKTGKLQTKRSYIGNLGFSTESTEEEVNEVEQVMYTIDCDLVLEDLGESFYKRIAELQESKRKTTVAKYVPGQYTMQYDKPYERTYQPGYQVYTPNSKVGKSTKASRKKNTFRDRLEDYVEHSTSEIVEDPDDMFELTSNREAGSFSPAKVKLFLIDTLKNGPGKEYTLDQILISKGGLSKIALDNYLCELELMFPEKVDTRFGVICNFVDYTAIAMSCIELLEPCKDLKIYDAVIDALMANVEDSVGDEEIERLTGLKLEKA